MLESKFSNKTRALAMEKVLPFPLVPEDPHDDRLFRTISFPTKDSHVQLKLKAIDINGEVSETLDQKSIPLGLPASEFDSHKDIYKVRAKLSMAIDGVKESHWVTQKHKNDMYADAMNQFRVRGVSKTGDYSDWVYSNIKDIHNEDFLFQLLHDVMDVILTSNDDKLEYLVDYLIEDAMTMLYRDNETELSKNFDHNFDVLSKLKEISEMIKTNIKKGFHEKIVSSIESFSSLVRSYKLMDRFQFEKTDFFTLLLESYLEDELDKIIQNEHYEAILKNDEEIQVLLQSLFEFDLKKSIIESSYRTELRDSFVSTMNDAVRLISEPSVYEEIVHKKNEEYFNLFRSMLRDIYASFLVLDQRTLDIETHLSDDSDSNPMERIIQFEFYDEDKTTKYLLLEDILHLLLEEVSDPVQEIAVHLKDYILTPTLEKKLAIWLDYAPIELIEYIANIKEDLHIKYTVKENPYDYKIESLINENTTEEKTKEKSSFEYSFRNALQIHTEVMDKYKDEKVRDTLIANLIDAYIDEVTIEDKDTNDKKPIHAISHIDLHFDKNLFVKEALQNLFFFEQLMIEKRSKDKYTGDIYNSIFDMSYGNIFKPHIKSINHALLTDTAFLNVSPHLFDRYILTEHDYVHYSLGNMTDGAPLGEFVVGSNSLTGQSDK